MVAPVGTLAGTITLNPKPLNPGSLNPKLLQESPKEPEILNRHFWLAI